MNFIINLDASIFVKFWEFYKYILKVKNLINKNDDLQQLCLMSLFLENNNYKIYFKVESNNINNSILLEKEIFYKQEEMLEIISLFLFNGPRFFSKKA